MGDMIEDSVLPEPIDLYRQFLLHPTVKPHTDAFQIETDPPKWLIEMHIADFDVYEAKVESWWNRSRCLLLDRENRRFFVSTVSEVRKWLMLRGGLFPNHTGRSRVGRRSSANLAVGDLFKWLDTQPAPTISSQKIQAWEARYGVKRAIEACVGAAFRLGFKADDVREMMFDAFSDPDGNQ